MTDLWLPRAKKHDLSATKGYGPFRPGMFLGVIVHVNVGHTSPAWYENNPEDVCPNFQVDKDGTIYQLLPLNWQPWTQRAGNSTYAAIETEGYPNERYTPAQFASIVYILDFYKRVMGMVNAIADAPGQKGIGTHRMGGDLWGGHSCPGDIRANQRREMVTALTPKTPTPAPHPVPKPVPHPVTHFPLPEGHYFGDINGPAQSHGGFYKPERAYVAQIQAQLRKRGFKVTDPAGYFRASTVAAVAAWQRKYYRNGTSLFGEVWPDDWSRLMGGGK